MATIQSSIGLTDQMSPILQSITNSLNMTISAMEKLSRESAASFNTDGFVSARAELNQAEIAMRNIGGQTEMTRQAQERYNQSVRNSHEGFNIISGHLRNIIGLYGMMRGMGIILKGSDELSSMEARLGNIKDSSHTTSQLFNQIGQSAIRARGDFAAMAQNVARIGYTAKGLFSNNELVQFTENVQKGFVIAGTTAQEASNAMLQLSQAMASGRMQGDELRSTLENNSAVSKALAEHLGVSIGQLKEMGADGEITAQIMKDAILNATDEINRDFEKMPLTFGQALQVMKTQAQMVFKGDMQTVASPFISAIKLVTTHLSTLRPVILGLSQMMAGLFVVRGAQMFIGFLSQASINIGLTSVATGALSAAQERYNLAMLTGSSRLGSNSIGLQLYAGASAVATGATNFLSGAVRALNAAFMANPVLFVINALLLLWSIGTVVFSYLNTKTFEWAGQTWNAGAVVAGIFHSIGTFVLNIIKNLWNTFAIFAEFLINLFINPKLAIVGLFVNMANNIFEIIKSLGSRFDKFATGVVNTFRSVTRTIANFLNPLIEKYNEFQGITGGKKIATINVKDNTKSIVTDWGKSIDDMNKKWDKMKKEDPKYYTVKKFEYGNLDDSFMEGYKKHLDKLNPKDEKGDISNDKINNWGSGLDSNPLKGGSDAEKRTADATEKMAKSMEASKEDLKYLRDISEQEAISRYTSPTITINLEATYNGSNNDTDIDGYHQQLADQVIDRLNSSYVGV